MLAHLSAAFKLFIFVVPLKKFHPESPLDPFDALQLSESKGDKCLLFLHFLISGQLRFDAAQQLKQKKAPPRPQVEFDLQNQPICPEFDGVYEDATYCDAYWKCANGVATEVFCDDGLVFDSRKAGHADPCDTPHVVECGSRQQLREYDLTVFVIYQLTKIIIGFSAKISQISIHLRLDFNTVIWNKCLNSYIAEEPTFPNEYCPRRHGSFEHPDPQVCNIYYMCVDAKFTEISCATGLYFNSTQGSCNWPHISQRTGCVDIPPCKCYYNSKTEFLYIENMR